MKEQRSSNRPNVRRQSNSHQRTRARARDQSESADRLPARDRRHRKKDALEFDRCGARGAGPQAFPAARRSGGRSGSRKDCCEGKACGASSGTATGGSHSATAGGTCVRAGGFARLGHARCRASAGSCSECDVCSGFTHCRRSAACGCSAAAARRYPWRCSCGPVRGSSSSRAASRSAAPCGRETCGHGSSAPGSTRRDTRFGSSPACCHRSATSRGCGSIRACRHSNPRNTATCGSAAVRSTISAAADATGPGVSGSAPRSSAGHASCRCAGRLAASRWSSPTGRASTSRRWSSWKISATSRRPRWPSRTSSNRKPASRSDGRGCAQG